MASKKTRSRKSISKRSAGAAKEAKRTKAKVTLLRTPFMAEFTKTFITGKWPVTGQKRADIVADFQVIVEVLSTVGYGLPAPTGLGPLGDQVVQFLGAPRNWPNNNSGIPVRLKDNLSTVALVDISVIVDRLLHAINSFSLVRGGRGGSPGHWPPH